MPSFSGTVGTHAVARILGGRGVCGLLRCAWCHRFPYPLDRETEVMLALWNVCKLSSVEHTPLSFVFNKKIVLIVTIKHTTQGGLRG